MLFGVTHGGNIATGRLSGGSDTDTYSYTGDVSHFLTNGPVRVTRDGQQVAIEDVVTTTPDTGGNGPIENTRNNRLLLVAAVVVIAAVVGYYALPRITGI